MKHNNLEQFISDNRAEFDNEEVPGRIWMQISQDLAASKSKRFNFYSYMRVAAVSTVLLCSGLIMGLQLSSGVGQNKNESLMNEFAEAESFYNNQYNVKWNEFEAQKEKDQGVEDDLNQLDAVYNELKQELLDNPNLNSEKVIDAMTENYKTKIAILEAVLEKTKNKNSLKSNNHETDKI